MDLMRHIVNVSDHITQQAMALAPAAPRAPIDVDIPPRHAELFAPPACRYLVLHGGRDSAKSWSTARRIIARCYEQRLRVLCLREVQRSVRDSVHKLLADQVYALQLGQHFTIQQQAITSDVGAEIIFEGLRGNVNRIKSLEGIDLCWVEEAESISDPSWQVLIPTIRKQGSQIVITFNPDLATDPTYQRFVVNPPPDARVVKVTWQDNPHHSATMEAERLYLTTVDPEAAAHVWGGECRSNSDAQVLRGKCRVESFEAAPGWDGPYFGADWGFSQDPTALVGMWISERTLYIEHEAYAVGCDIDKTPALFDTVPGARSATIRADNARPETISYMQRNGYSGVVACQKWDGSVEDGVAFLRQFEAIVIHPRCTHVAEEARLWSYKKDRLTGDITTTLVDKSNHTWDAVRYGLGPLIKQSDGLGIFNFYKEMAEREEKAA